MLTSLLLIACQRDAEPTVGAPGLQVTVVARISAEASVWSASAGGLAPSSALLPGECAAIQTEATPIPAFISGLRVTGAIAAALLPEPWRTAAPLALRDPAWLEADLLWTMGDALGERTLSRAVRFGPTPVVAEVTEGPGGAVRVRWDADSATGAEVWVTGEQALRCGVGRAGTVLPEWALRGADHLALRSTSTTRLRSGDLDIVVNAVTERMVPLTAPAATSTPALPPAPALAPSAPVRVRVRPARG